MPDRQEDEQKVLWVAADKPGLTDTQRKDALRKLAGATAHTLRRMGEAHLRCFGNAAIGKAAKALAMARAMVASQGFDLYCVPGYISAEMGEGENRIVKNGGICFYAFTQEHTPPQIENPGNIARD